jgi:hypothetical protein
LPCPRCDFKKQYGPGILCSQEHAKDCKARKKPPAVKIPDSSEGEENDDEKGDDDEDGEPPPGKGGRKQQKESGEPGGSGSQGTAAGQGVSGNYADSETQVITAEMATASADTIPACVTAGEDDESRCAQKPIPPAPGLAMPSGQNIIAAGETQVAQDDDMETVPATADAGPKMKVQTMASATESADTVPASVSASRDNDDTDEPDAPMAPSDSQGSNITGIPSQETDRMSEASQSMMRKQR